MDAIYTADATARGREGRAVSSDGRSTSTLAIPVDWAATAAEPTPSSSSPPATPRASTAR